MAVGQAVAVGVAAMVVAVVVAEVAAVGVMAMDGGGDGGEGGLQWHRCTRELSRRRRRGSGDASAHALRRFGVSHLRLLGNGRRAERLWR